MLPPGSIGVHSAESRLCGATSYSIDRECCGCEIEREAVCKIRLLRAVRGSSEPSDELFRLRVACECAIQYTVPKGNVLLANDEDVQ